ncbi:5590_t:CDS:2 [Dentiscutata heterogama]|uniref:5590_t:CDS:1 n=1 Tax=Dentiscutata heterogama TaxID=1316150 RepID=A0ACA9MEC6_9GLOM|nr:5590_t:CDS:2 [Dentiscutata heterogama]
MTNIDNRKCNCSNCNEKLDTLATLQKESLNEFTKINIASQSKSLVIKPYTYIHEQKSSNFDRYGNQYQGLDTILEEVNKSLKALILPVSLQKHWRIAAHNCTKFMKLRRILFNMIGHMDNELSEGRAHPDYILESYRFQVHLCKTRFLNPQDNNRDFKSLEREHPLSEQLKNFTNLAYER